MLNTCTTPDPVTLIVSMGHLLGLLVRICLLHMTENPAFYTSLLSFSTSQQEPLWLFVSPVTTKLIVIHTIE